MTILDRDAERAAADRARDLALNHLLGFVREARRNGWDPGAFIPPIAWQLGHAISQANAYLELTRNRE